MATLANPWILTDVLHSKLSALPQYYNLQRHCYCLVGRQKKIETYTTVHVSTILASQATQCFCKEGNMQPFHSNNLKNLTDLLDLHLKPFNYNKPWNKLMSKNDTKTFLP